MRFLYKLRLLRVRVLWFIRNYNNIFYSTGLYNDELYGPPTYKTDGLITSSNADFIKQPRFRRAYELAAETNPWPNFTLQWRVHVVCWYAEQVKCLDGDFVECGVNTGAYSRAVIEYIGFKGLEKKFYLLDTFNGLSENLVSDEEKKAGVKGYFGSYKDVYEQVKNTFKGFDVEIIKGVVPDTLPFCQTKKVCYLSIDMNCVEPEIAAVKYFWDKLVPGGVIILDDYGFPAHIHQKIAFDKFAEEHKIEILSLPTGQGIIIKPLK